RATHREVGAFVIEHMPLAFVIELARRFVVEEGIRVPGVPQPLDDVNEFARTRVPGGVLELRVAVEVERFRLRPGGDDIPAGAALADQIERGEGTGDMIG